MMKMNWKTTVMAVMTKHLMDPVVAPSARRPDLGISAELDRLVSTPRTPPHPERAERAAG